ncbi:MAG: DnaA/Hda family protein [Rhodobacteraceae bacterium]|nr:DnaA/Hda family protein [Paracoccaceae bacterium]
MPRQLTFNLPMRTALGREDFFVSPANTLALAMLDAPDSWPQGKLLLIGPEGAGKSHLAAVWANGSNAISLPACALTEKRVPELVARKAILIEDADRIAGRAERETALFHLHNLALASGTRLLLTARAEPNGWGLALPDLASRMAATALARIEAPDDALLAAVFLKLFADRQLQVSPTLVPYLISRIDRSFATARALATALDARALALGRPLTRSLAADLLDSWPHPGP